VQARIKELRVNYDDFELKVSGLVFEAEKVSVLVGPNGAGKSTLLKALAGVLSVKPGSIFIGGRDLAFLRGAEKASLLSYVPQEQALVFNHSVFDFILMGRSGFLSLFSRPSPDDYRKTEEVISYLGLEAFSRRKYTELSSGERRIVLIGRALAQDSMIIVLDEPTTFLDPKHEIQIIDLMKKLATERGKTIITSLHSLELIPRLADFLILLKNGQILASGPAREVFKTELLVELFEYPLKVAQAEGQTVLLR